MEPERDREHARPRAGEGQELELSLERKQPVEHGSRAEEGDGRTGEQDSSDGAAQRGRVFLTLGEKDGADEAKVRAAVSALAPGVELAAVEVRQNHSFLVLEPGAAEGLVSALNGKEWEGRTLSAEKARRRRR